MITGKTLLAGVMGWPIGHSRSPRLHNHWLRQCGIDGAYVPMAVRPERILQALKALPALGFRGVNITLPHKEMAARIVDARDAFAERIGAVNTVVVREDGTLYGMNTDTFGFSENLRTAGYDFKRGPAALMGAGGSAKAIVAALIAMECPAVMIFNRTPDRAVKVMDALKNVRTKITCVAWDKRHDAIADASLVINATTQGMVGEPPLDLRLDKMPAHGWVTDCVYNPLVTPLLAAAKARGLKTADGVGMLMYQAVPGFQAWFGADPAVDDELRRLLSEGL